jgi:dolichyl-phosphate beta-glucosyltransferase
VTNNQLKEHGAGGILLIIIIPAYNEASTIENTLVQTVNFLGAQQYEWEIIVIDDASTDATVERVSLFKTIHSGANIRLLCNDNNRKKGGSVQRGILAAEGKYCMFTDADYAYPITQLNSFLKPLEDGADVVIGNRTDPGTTYIVRPVFFSYIYQRYVLSRIYNTLVRLFLIKDVRDTQCGLKAFNTLAAKNIMKKITTLNFAFDVELLHIARSNGMTIVQVPVTFNYIEEPSSVRLIKDSLAMLRSLFRIKRNSYRKKYQIG